MTDPARRARLLSIKLAALARDHGVAADHVVPADFGLGAALTAGTSAWLLADQDPARSLGPAIAWSLRHGATEVDLLAERGTGILARRAECFTLPVRVWHVDDRVLLPAVAEPLPVAASASEGHEAFRALIVEAGATPIVEHGVLSGEVDGLEVCRVVDDDATGTARLEVGIGAHDREAFQLLHGDRPAVDALADVVALVAAQRAPGARPHPLNLLAQERALRAAIVAEPALIGASEVHPVPPPSARQNLKDAVPCVAAAVVQGERVTVVCSTGVDLDVVPFATDALRVAGTSRCLVVLPARDALPVQQLIAGAAAATVDIVAVDRAPGPVA